MFQLTFKFFFVIICSCPLEVLLSWLFSCMWQFEQIPIGPTSIVIIFLLSFVFGNNIYVKTWLHPWEKFLLFIHTCTKKIKHFVNQSLIVKEIKPWHPLGVHPQCNLEQINHKSTSLTNLMEHIQSFGVLSTKCT